jgi:hypothetical protein
MKEGWSTDVGHLIGIRTGAARFLDHGSSNPLGSNKRIDLGGRERVCRGNEPDRGGGDKACWGEGVAAKEFWFILLRGEPRFPIHGS